MRDEIICRLIAGLEGLFTVLLSGFLFIVAVPMALLYELISAFKGER